MKRLLKRTVCALFALILAAGLSACGGEQQKPTFPAPQNVRVEGETLLWDGVDGAERYTVKINLDETTETEETALSLSAVKAKLRVGRNVLSVRANGTAERAESAYSAETGYNYVGESGAQIKLGKPADVYLSGSVLRWESVLHASGYMLQINGGEEIPVGGLSFDLAQLFDTFAVGPNLIAVKATGGGGYVDGDYTSPVEYLYYLPFGAPQNLRIEHAALLWDGVDGALSYTVRINGGKTITVAEPCLDLAAAAESLLDENTAAVKANGNDLIYRSESAYSGEIRFDFDREAVTAADGFNKLVGEIGTLTQEHTQAQAEEIGAAIAAAHERYGALDARAKTYAQEAYALLAQKEEAYAQETEAARRAHAAFTDSLQAAEREAEAQASLPRFRAAAETVRETGALTPLAQGLVTGDEAERTAAVFSALSAWEHALSAAKDALGAPLTVPDPQNDRTAEARLAEIAPRLDMLEHCPPYILADGEIQALRGDLIKAEEEARAQIARSVSALKGEIDGALTDTAPTRENYDRLAELLARAAELGSYGGSLFSAYRTGELEEAAARMLTVAVAYSVYETFLCNHRSSMSEYVVFRSAVNLLGQPVGEEEDLTVLARAVYARGGTEEEKTLSPSVMYRNGTAVVRIPLERPQAGDAVLLTYALAGEEKTVRLGAPDPIFYFATGDKTENRAYNAGGELAAAASVWFDVYDASSADLSQGYGDKDLILTGAPLLTRLTRSDVATLSALRFSLASHALFGKRDVILVGYRYTEEGDTVRYSYTNTASLSDPVALNVTRDDLRLAVSGLKKDEAGGQTWSLGEGDTIDYEWDILRNKPLWDEVHINVYDVRGKDAQTYDFLRDTPFAVWSFSETGFKKKSDIEEAIDAAWMALPARERALTYTFVYAIQVLPNADAAARGYLPSALVYACLDGARQIGEYSFVRPVSHVTYDLGIWGGAHNFSLIGKQSEAFYSQFSVAGMTVTEENAADYLEILLEVTDGEEILFSAAVPFRNQSYSFDRLMSDWARVYFSSGAPEQWVSFRIDVSVRVKDEVNGQQNPLKRYFLPSEKKTLNELALDGQDCRTFHMQRSAFTAPAPCLFGFANKNVEFLKADGMDRGGVFADYFAECVLLRFSRGEESYTAYLFAEYGRLMMYADGERQSEPLDLGVVTNAWTSADAVNAYFAAQFSLTAFDILDGWQASTKIVAGDGCVWMYDGAWSDPVSYYAF